MEWVCFQLHVIPGQVLLNVLGRRELNVRQGERGTLRGDSGEPKRYVARLIHFSIRSDINRFQYWDNQLWTLVGRGHQGWSIRYQVDETVQEEWRAMKLELRVNAPPYGYHDSCMMQVIAILVYPGVHCLVQLGRQCKYAIQLELLIHLQNYSLAGVTDETRGTSTIRQKW